MAKIDFKRTLSELYRPSGREFSVVEVPSMPFLMIDGHGDPNTDPAYQRAVEALYAVAYKVKFASKEEGRDYVVPPLEGLWWADDMRSFAERLDKSAWDWTMMMMQPEWITDAQIAEAKAQAAETKDLPALGALRCETYDEGLAVQILHVGPYDAEGPVIRRMHQVFMPDHGYEPDGRHHEIYLSDPRRTAPERLKTVIRQPVRRV